MKCLPNEMRLFELDYGELIRPPFQILPSRGWGQCTNQTSEILIVYGPKHTRDRSICDTSPYILESGHTTPDGWDCDGIYIPRDRGLAYWRGLRSGPLAAKFWNFRRFRVVENVANVYRCPLPNGVFEPSTINWAIPSLAYEEIATRAAKHYSY